MQQISQSEQVKAIEAKQFDKASSLMPSKIEQTFEQPKIREVAALVGEKNVILQLEFELIKLASLMSVGGNLTASQIKFIAEQLVQLFPNESIADFKICFQRGSIGQYGDIQRMDGITVRTWFEAYLDEKYRVLEDKLMKEKETIYEPIQTSTDADKYINELLEVLKPTEKVRDITPKEIQEEGREKPKAYKHPSTPESLVRQKFLHDEWIRQNFDPYTGKKKPNFIDEETWLNQLEHE